MGLLMVLGILVGLLVVGIIGCIQWGKRSRLRGTMPVIVNQNRLEQNEIPELRGKVAIVTGASAGLGKSSVMHLAKAGATVIMACRSYDKAQKAKAEIVNKIGNEFKGDRIFIKLLDLNSLASVRAFTDDFLQDFIRLDMLMLNAGIALQPFGLTEDGIETQIGVNHFGHFYLTELLLPVIIKSQPASIVSVSSLSNFDAPKEGVRLTLDELNDESRYNPMAAYGQSKLANILFTKELARRMEADNLQVYVNSVHPGLVATELGRHFPKWVDAIVQVLLKFFTNRLIFESDKAAMTQVYASVAPVVLKETFNGRYFVPLGEDAEPNVLANDEDLQKGLWSFSEEVLRSKGF